MEFIKTMHYVTQDPMHNFKIKVTLTRLSADTARPQDGRIQGGDSGADGSSSPAGADSAAGAVSSSGNRTAPQQVVRIFAWQEKVYSKAEFIAAQAQATPNQQRPGQHIASRRSTQFALQSQTEPDRLQTAPEGALLFSYIQTDDFIEQYETSKGVTTSTSERQNHLAKKLLKDPHSRQKMLGYHAMFIMADLGGAQAPAGSEHKVLCIIRTASEGSFDMTPGFNTPGHKYRCEDQHGGMYEYVLEPASCTAAPSLEKRAAKLAVAVAAQAKELREQGLGLDHMPSPGPEGGTLRLMLLGELMSAAGFQRDRLYIEWQLRYDPGLWILQHNEQELVQPGIIQGVSHVSRMVQYPADPSTDSPAVWVAHFAHPLEVEWVAKAAPNPKDWPHLLLQVCTYDLWDRFTTEGYGWLQLTGWPGSRTQYVETWKPLGTRRDRQQAFFIGGSEELQDLSYIAVPQGHKGPVLNKYGCKTETSGVVKVRLHTMLQGGTSGGMSPRKAAANKGGAAAARQRRELSLAVVLERARSRLQEARGGEVCVREGVVAQRPAITVQPADVTVVERGNAQFSVTATGIGPLRYQWYKDNKRLTVATANSSLLILVDVGGSESGSYHCQVSNKDGAVTSSKALLTITRTSRLQQATGAGLMDSMGRRDRQLVASASPPLSNTLTKRTTIPRTLDRGGSGLPYSPRYAGAASSSTSTPATLSPLRQSLAKRPLVGSEAGSVRPSGHLSPFQMSYSTIAAAVGNGSGHIAGTMAAVASSSTAEPDAACEPAAAQGLQQQEHQQPELAEQLPPSTFASAAHSQVMMHASRDGSSNQAIGAIAFAAVGSPAGQPEGALPIALHPAGPNRRQRVSEQQ